jgi:glycosyltransferase involved in cell wall biosynthesis
MGGFTLLCKLTMISVIIPTFNRARFLKQALHSLLAQQRVDMEVIVVDDGSTDDTAAIVASCGVAVRYIHQVNAGVSAARNRGIRAAAGEWLAFLDSDDFWLPHKLEAQLDFFRRHPELRICQTEELWMRNGLRMNPRKYHQKPSGYCFPSLLERCLISPSAVMIHRGLLNEVGLFDENLPACEDYDLWLRIGCRQPIGFIEQAFIVKQGGHPDQLSACIPSLDKYRITALTKLLCSGVLTSDQQELVLATLTKKCRS